MTVTTPLPWRYPKNIFYHTRTRPFFYTAHRSADRTDWPTELQHTWTRTLRPNTGTSSVRVRVERRERHENRQNYNTREHEHFVPIQAACGCGWCGV